MLYFLTACFINTSLVVRFVSLCFFMSIHIAGFTRSQNMLIYLLAFEQYIITWSDLK